MDIVYYLRDALRLTYEETKESVQMTNNHSHCSQDVHYDEFKEIKFHTVEIKQKLKLSEDLLRPLVELNPMDRYCF